MTMLRCFFRVKSFRFYQAQWWLIVFFLFSVLTFNTDFSYLQRLAHVHEALSFVSAPVILNFYHTGDGWTLSPFPQSLRRQLQIVSERKSRRYSNVSFFLYFIATSFFFTVALRLLKFPPLFLSFSFFSHFTPLLLFRLDGENSCDSNKHWCDVQGTVECLRSNRKENDIKAVRRLDSGCIFIHWMYAACMGRSFCSF